MIVSAIALLPAIAHAADDGETLTPSLQELAKPSVRALPRAEQAELLGVAASGPGSLLRADGRVLVEALFEPGEMDRLPAVEAAGGDVLLSSRRYQAATISVPYGDLREVGEVPGLSAVTPALAPVVREPGCQGGAVISEGITQLNVEAARTKLGEIAASKEGEGLTIGVLSDSMAQATEAVGGGKIATQQPEDVAANELPGEASSCEGEKDPVKELKPWDPSKPGFAPTDEGRAMLQIIHDVVPKAKLAFYSAFNTELDFADGIRKLASPVGSGGAEANVIVDDVGYFGEPFFQDGPVAVAVNEVVADGVTYLTSAGNDNLLDAENNEFASWEAPAFRDSGDCPKEVRALTLVDYNTTHCLDFNPEAPVDRTYGIKVQPGQTLTIDLQWAQPWNKVTTDLDAFLLDAEGRLLAFAPVNNVSAKRPFEVLTWENNSGVERTVQLVVNRFIGVNPRLKLILLQNGGGVSGTEYPRSGGGDVVGPAIYGHAGAASAITVGAVPYNNSNRIERYSSRGPVTHFFGPVVGSGSAPPLGSPEVISKPDIAATDCGRTTFFSFQPEKELGTWRFCGTSAAAPHAAGIAALALEAGAGDPGAVATALEGTGRMVGPFGACAAGAGLVDALATVEAFNGGPTTPPSSCSPPNSADPVERAAGNWGLEQPPEEPKEPEEPKKPEEPEKPKEVPNNPPTTDPPTTNPPTETKTPPVTAIRTHPKKLVRTPRALARVVFRFASDPAGASFRCQFDGSPWRACPATVKRWFGLGQHVVRVQAISKGAGADPSAAVFRFRVARTR